MNAFENVNILYNIIKPLCVKWNLVVIACKL